MNQRGTPGARRSGAAPPARTGGRMSKHGITWVVVFGVITLMFMRLPQMAATQDTVVNTYGALVEVDALIKQQYVEPIEGDRLVEGAIRGMMRQLDPYSGYIAPHELAQIF